MTRRARVLHVAAVEYTVEYLLLPQLRALTAAGYDVRVACAPGPAGFSPPLQPYRPAPVAFPRTPDVRRSARAARDLVRVVRTWQPEVVHLHSPAAALPARCIPRGLLPRHTRIVYTVHGFAHQWGSGRRRDVVLERAERTLAGRTDALLFQSREDHEQAQLRGYRSRLVLLGNGVQDDWFRHSPEGHRRGTPLRLLFVGRLVEEKGLLDLLGAVEQVPGVRLDVVGGQLESERDGVADELRRRAETGPLAGRLRLLGVLSQDALRRQMAESDVFVLPSYREGVPRSVIEALATGTPVVATDIRGCRELVQQGANGFLVPPGDPAALASALSDVVSLADRAYAELRAAAARSAEPHRESRVLQRLLDAYAALGLAPSPRGVTDDSTATP